jgi:UDP-N-acetyl-D-galactosamine dehydrogenase
MTTIAVIGLGYVGLPLALEFGAHFFTIGYDISTSKIEAYFNNQDPSGEVGYEQFSRAIYFTPTNNIENIKIADFIIIAMPTPVDENNIPDFECLVSASQLVGANMKKGCTVIYESTVYPGATEEICIPVLEQFSNMTWLTDFNVGYSPERISPGDKERTLTKIKKIVSGDTEETLGNVSALYETIITAGIYKASSIRVAEAAKVIENIQRDVNIALMNELATIFHKLKLDTNDVIDAASSKWNFVGYRPGLVGGHCIGVDPYYLIHKAGCVGHDSMFLKQSRFVNASMPRFIVEETLKGFETHEALTVAILGVTFKENCKDIRNSKVFELIQEYQKAGLIVYAHDPIADVAEVLHEYGVLNLSFENIPICDIVVLASAHKEFLEIDPQILISKVERHGVFVDVKSKMNQQDFEGKHLKLWRL